MSKMNNEFESEDGFEENWGLEPNESQKYLPNSPLMQDFHSQVQLYGRVSLVFGILLGIATAIFGIGLAFIGLAIGAYGIMERKKWGIKWAKISLWIIAAVAMIGLGLLTDKRPIQIVEDLPFFLSFTLIPFFSISIVASIAGLVVLYSRKMKYYI